PEGGQGRSDAKHQATDHAVALPKVESHTELEIGVSQSTASGIQFPSAMMDHPCGGNQQNALAAALHLETQFGIRAEGAVALVDLAHRTQEEAAEHEARAMRILDRLFANRGIGGAPGDGSLTR